MGRSGFIVVPRFSHSGVRILGITRGARPHDWSFPGGGIEPHETWEEGVARELEEETGVRLVGMSRVYAIGGFRRPDGREIRYLTVEGPVRWPDELASTPFEGWVDLVTPGQLCSGACTFRRENAGVLAALGLS